MALVTSQEMFKKAYEGKYAVGAFNVNNMEIIQGIVEAAKQEKDVYKRQQLYHFYPLKCENC